MEGEDSRGRSRSRRASCSSCRRAIYNIRLMSTGQRTNNTHDDGVVAVEAGAVTDNVTPWATNQIFCTTTTCWKTHHCETNCLRVLFCLYEIVSRAGGFNARCSTGDEGLVIAQARVISGGTAAQTRAGDAGGSTRYKKKISEVSTIWGCDAHGRV